MINSDTSIPFCGLNVSKLQLKVNQLADLSPDMLSNVKAKEV
jgi:hypothetical protein